MDNKDIVEAARSMSRKDKDYIVFLSVMESLLTGARLYSEKFPTDKQEKIKPITDLLLNVGSELSDINDVLRDEIRKKYKDKYWNDMIACAVRIVEVAFGQNEQCQQCIASNKNKILHDLIAQNKNITKLAD